MHLIETQVPKIFFTVPLRCFAWTLAAYNPCHLYETIEGDVVVVLNVLSLLVAALGLLESHVDDEWNAGGNKRPWPSNSKQLA